jgi:hypothetical protein
MNTTETAPAITLAQIGQIVERIEDLLVEFTFCFANTDRRIEILRQLGLETEIDQEAGTLIMIDRRANLPDGRSGGCQLGVYDATAWSIVVTTLNPLMFGKLINLNRKLEEGYKAYRKANPHKS